jgi:ABC-type lipoprotein export system ATPase subunit
MHDRVRLEANEDHIGVWPDAPGRLHRRTIAFIFQSFGLIPMLSAAENVGIPLRISGTDPRAREERVALMLAVRTVVQSEGITALVATHDTALMDLADEVLRLEDGRITAP